MVEMQFGDFISCGFNQIVNNLAKTHYRWGQGLPVVIRVPVGGGTGAGPVPLAEPGSLVHARGGREGRGAGHPHDAKGLLLAAFRGRKPGALPRAQVPLSIDERSVPEGYYTEPIGPAKVARDGSDVTIVTWGVGVTWALDAAERRGGAGLRRSDRPSDAAAVGSRHRARLRPQDQPRAGASRSAAHRRVRRRGRGPDRAGWLSAALDAPVTRVAGLDIPVPFSKALEEIYSPRGRLARGARGARRLLMVRGCAGAWGAQGA